jgi:hypothetical protein
MSILEKHLFFVKEQVDFQNRLANKFSKDDEQRSYKHVATRDKFASLLEAMTTADEQLDAIPNSSVNGAILLTLRPVELEGLPEELLSELSEGAVPDKMESTVIQSIDARGGVATLDQLLVDIYRATQEVVKRALLTSRLYRMVQKGAIFSVPGKKGIYSTKRILQDDLNRITGQEAQDLDLFA